MIDLYKKCPVCKKDTYAYKTYNDGTVIYACIHYAITVKGGDQVKSYVIHKNGFELNYNLGTLSISYLDTVKKILVIPFALEDLQAFYNNNEKFIEKLLLIAELE